MSPFMHRRRWPRRFAALAAVVVVVGIAGCASSDPVMEASDQSSPTTTLTAGASATGPPSTTVDGTDGDASSQPPADANETGDPDPSTPDTVTTDPPLEPTGLFINTHELSRTGTGAPQNGHSVCQTSPGATCEIRFLSGGDVAGSLTAKRVDENGVVSWDWDPAGVGLHPGTYQVEVVAARGGHEVTVSDARDLVVVD